MCLSPISLFNQHPYEMLKKIQPYSYFCFYPHLSSPFLLPLLPLLSSYLRPQVLARRLSPDS